MQPVNEQRLAGDESDEMDLVVDLLGSPREDVWPADPEPPPTDLRELELAEPAVQLEDAGVEIQYELTDLETSDLLQPPTEPSDWIDDDACAASADLDLTQLSDARATPDDDDWPDEPVDAPDLALDEISAEIDDSWDPAADEMHMLPPGRIRIGFEEHVSIGTLSENPLHALCDPSSATSALRLKHRRLPTGEVEAALGGQIRRLDIDSLAPEGTPIVSVELVLGPHSCQARFRLENQSATIPVLLGRDVLAGAFVIDPAERFVLDT